MNTAPNKIYTLRKPIKMVDDIITELELREPTIGEVIKAEAKGHGYEMLLSLIGQVVGIDPVFLKELTLNDFKAVSGIISDFTSEDGPQTGEH